MRGELAVHRAEYDAAVELYNDTLLGALREVADSLSAWQATREMLDSHRRLVTSLSEDWRLAKVRLVSGLDDDREVAAPLSRAGTRIFNAGLGKRSVVAAVDLIEALGGGYHNPDIEKRPTKQAAGPMSTTHSMPPPAPQMYEESIHAQRNRRLLIVSRDSLAGAAYGTQVDLGAVLGANRQCVRDRQLVPSRLRPPALSLRC